MDHKYTYEICIEGILAEGWSDWFEGMAIRVDPAGETILRGPLTDQAALLGVLSKLHALNLALISVKRLSNYSPPV